MSIRVHPTRGKGWWYIQYRPQGRKGKLVTVPFEGTKGDALLIEAELRRQNRVDRVSAYPKIAEVIPDYMASYKLDHQPLGVERTIYSLNHLLSHFGPHLFTSVTPALVGAYKANRLQKVTPSTINKELAALSGLCKWAADRGYCQPIKIKRFPAKLTRAPLPNVPTRIEILALLNSMDWPRCGLMACLYLAGLRISEANNMIAERIYPDRGVMLVVGKGNKERVVPIIHSLETILDKRLKEVTAGLLWKGVIVKDLRPAIKWASKRAGITRKITPHALRHAFGVHATESGVGLKSLQQVMGHSTSQVTEIYTHLAAEALVKEMGKFG